MTDIYLCIICSSLILVISIQVSDYQYLAIIVSANVILLHLQVKFYTLNMMSCHQ